MLAVLARAAGSGALALTLIANAPAMDAPVAAATPQAEKTGQQVDRAAAKKSKNKKKKAPSAGRVAKAMKIAVHQKGDPYRSGAAGPGSFDCSGLVFYSFRRAGFGKIPRTSGAQAHFAKRIPRSKMKRGDLMFFYDGGGVYHVGVYTGFTKGKRWVLHAPYSGTRVRADKVWTDRWYAGTLRYR